MDTTNEEPRGLLRPSFVETSLCAAFVQLYNCFPAIINHRKLGSPHRVKVKLDRVDKAKLDRVCMFGVDPSILENAWKCRNRWSKMLTTYTLA